LDRALDDYRLAVVVSKAAIVGLAFFAAGDNIVLERPAG
jgi:hypothetical protein